MEWPKITLFGDSITRRSTDPENGCWASYISHQVRSYFDVDVRGFEGYNSGWALDLMPKLFSKSYLKNVEIFTLFFGHNDSFQDKKFPSHVPIEKFEVNMRAIIKYLLDNGLDKSKIIMITPAWYYDEAFEKYLKEVYNMPPFKKNLTETKEYADAVKRIANQEAIEVLDFFEVTSNYEPLEELFCDGIHFSKIGAKLLYDNLMPIIEKKLEVKFEKPLADLYHVIPMDKRPEVVSLQEELMKLQTK